MTPTEFWKPFETVLHSYDDLAKVIDEVFTKWSAKNKVFAWRGQVNAGWPLYSSLYRRLSWTRATSSPPEERHLYSAEGKILVDVHRWGLHASGPTGRLPILSQLAALRHYGAPTRLIDITFNPWIGAWFAVEQKWHNTDNVHENEDARLFAIDVTGRLINERDSYRDWEDRLSRPWPSRSGSDDSDETRTEYRRWCTEVFAWRPPHFDARIAAQNGGFLLGGVPVSSGPDGPKQWPKDGSGKRWHIAEVRGATSVSLRPHKLQTQKGGVAQDAVYTFRITAGAKVEIRDRLERNFDYKHATMYPDFTGFASFGTSTLKSGP